MFNAPPHNPGLKTGQLHIWAALLDQPEPQMQMFSRTLSQEELDRAARFVFERDRRRFTVSRGILRNILSGYMNLRSDRITFRYGTKGKPELVDLSDNKTVRFNMAHSEDLALYAFSFDQEVGVDVEYMRDMNEMEQLAGLIFSTEEIVIFRSLSEDKKKEAFYNGWTRKEAFVKALGDGLSMPLDTFDVSFIPGQPARLTRIEGEAGKISGWSIKDLKPALSYAAALAVKGPVFNTRYLQWDSNFK